ncbi:hypothetical protein DFJ73DRAFT_756430 [Zopfochytrium polystomum]|nr:hypothetical protein DFJ73DRAFT_756430 [Zopfochytrium polystomum]
MILTESQQSLTYLPPCATKGFTLLTTRLFREHGSDGAAELVDAINSPFDRIIERVYRRSGSIVKFAGDSAVVCWSEPSCSSSRQQELLVESFVCCLELLRLFKEGLSIDFEDNDGGATVGIHVGIGYGCVSHSPLGAERDGADWKISSGATTSTSTERATGQFPENELDRVRGMRYIESSVVQYLIKEGFADEAQEVYSLSRVPRRASRLSSPSPMKHLTDNYSDLRCVAVAFFRFPGVFNCSVNPESINVAQSVAQAVIACVDKHEGSLRQVNFDDKAFTALAVWGLRGSAHQRSESLYALQGCLDFAESVRQMEEASSKMHQQLQGATIGVATGTVYAGLIGNDTRKDGTVMGTTVNLAARLMCMDGETFFGKDVHSSISLYCDDSTFQACKNQYEFHKSPAHMSLRGFDRPLPVYKLVKEKDKSLEKAFVPDRELVGRATEMQLINEVVREWNQGAPNQRIFILARSGYGKSAIAHHAFRQFEESSRCILCSSVAHEMKQKTSFAFLGLILRALSARLISAGLKPSDFAAGNIRTAIQISSSHSLSLLRHRGNSTQFDRCSSFLFDMEWSLDYNCQKKHTLQLGTQLPALASIIARILDSVAKLGLSVIIACDDGQLCPQVLFIILGRKREEWLHHELFDVIKDQCTHTIELGPLKTQAVRAYISQSIAVSDELMQEIIERSNGIPIALHVILATVKTQINLPMAKSGLPREQTESEIGGAVSAQLDSLPEQLRQIISVAAIIGQYFSLQTLSELLNALKASEGEDLSVGSIKRMLEAADRFGFVEVNPTDADSCAFCHFLIYRSVIAALLPHQRDTIRRKLITLLIGRLDQDGSDDLMLPTIIHHVMQLKEESQMKAKYLYKGFVAAAEAWHFEEALNYRVMLIKIDGNYFESLSMTAKMRDLRLQMEIFFQNGDTARTVSAASQLLRLAGASFAVPAKSLLTVIKSTMQCLNILRSILRVNSVKALNICAKFLAESFPLAFPKGLSSQRRGKISTIHPHEQLDTWADAAESGEGLIRLDSIITILETSVALFYFAKLDGLDFVYLQMATVFLSLIGIGAVSDDAFWIWRFKQSYHRLGIMLFGFGLKSQSERCFQAAEAFLAEGVTPRELECKADCKAIEAVMSFFRKNTVDFDDVVLLCESVACQRAAGNEFQEMAKTHWFTLLWFLLTLGMMLGKFQPETKEDGRFVLGEVYERAQKFCVDRKFVLHLRSCFALQNAFRTDFSEAESVIALLAKNETACASLGLEALNRLNRHYISLNFICCSILLIERRLALFDSLNGFFALTSELCTGLDTVPVQFGLGIPFTCIIVAILLLGMGLSLQEAGTLDMSHQRKHGGLVRKPFVKLCVATLGAVVDMVFDGNVNGALRKLRKFVKRPDRRLPTHVVLMLEARLIRLRRLCEGADGVAGPARNLLESFRGYDNRCDPDLVKELCCC